MSRFEGGSGLAESTVLDLRRNHSSQPEQNVVTSWLRYLNDRRLITAAVLAWGFTALAFGLAIFTSVLPSVIIALYVIAYLAGGTDATREAIADLFDGHVNVDLLMVLAALGAASLGAWVEGAVLLALFSSSNALEHHALDRTRGAVQALMELSPDEASRIASDGSVEIVSVDALQVGDRVLIRPGGHVPADSRVVDGRSSIDQSAITGESIPVERGVGDDLFSGTLNGTGALTAEVVRLPSESTLAKIVRMVESARDQKSRTQRFTDAFEGPYAIAVIAASALLGVGSALFGSDAGDAFYRSMTLLVVASPCALVISIPAATLSGLANAARNGILVKGGNYLEDLGSVTTVAFDKTGTLTVGELRITDIIATSGIVESELLRQVATVESRSEHPLARAIVDAAQARGIPLLEVANFVSMPGLGVSADVDGQRILVGTGALMERHGVEIPNAMGRTLEELGGDGKTAMLVAVDDLVAGVIAAADTVRPESAAVVANLRKLGVRHLVMLTGDNDQVARAVARQVGIDDVRANLLPDQKLAQIEALRRDGGVVMVGDGVNDAPALALADIGIAMGGRGTDVALETADVVLMQDDLHRLPYAIDLSRRTRTTIRWNIGFSLSVIVVLIASTLSVGIPLPLGVVGHEGSTIIVVLNGLRLLRG
ncbi:MAG: cadmium-translocating P-type ATPase [Chloroflexota bacterium]|nr:cadmium-translocating P-type ATPase [Chloroflexota bacterium]